MTASYIILFLSVAIGVAGQILLKHSTLVVGKQYLIHPMINQYFVYAMAVYFLSVLLYTTSLKSIPLNIAYPSVSISYVAVSYASHIIWGTSFGIREIGGLLLIFLGIVVLFSGNVE